MLLVGRSSCTVPAGHPHPHSNNFIEFFVRHVNWSSCIYQSQRVLTRMGRQPIALTRRRLLCAHSVLEYYETDMLVPVWFYYGNE